MRISPGEKKFIPRSGEDVIIRGPPRWNIIAVVTSNALITKQSSTKIEVPIQPESDVLIHCDETHDEKGRREYIYRFSMEAGSFES
jgi:hypothetical protein